MCEHKGIGHPDTLTDGACEAAAVALAGAYLSTFGEVFTATSIRDCSLPAGVNRALAEEGSWTRSNSLFAGAPSIPAASSISMRS